MTYAIATYDDLIPACRLRSARQHSFQPLPLLVGLAGSALVACLILDVDPAHSPGISRHLAASPVAAAKPAEPDPALALAFASAPLGQTAPVDAGFQAAAPAPKPTVVAETDATAVVVEAPAPLPPVRPSDDDTIVPAPPAGVSPLVASAPLPVPRPADLPERPAPGPVRMPSRLASRVASPAAAPTPDTRSVFEKLFGLSAKPSGPALAYAAPEDGVASRLFGSVAPANPDRQTAVYDISAHTVYLPDGSRLEAHSGLGPLLDDPRSIAAKNRGVTPPTLYDLTLREKLFHGVQALRLTPVGNGRVFGRVGLLAHTFMLGPNGDSNGCVSFRNYSAFLQAFRNGDIRRLQVVTHRV